MNKSYNWVRGWVGGWVGVGEGGGGALICCGQLASRTPAQGRFPLQSIASACNEPAIPGRREADALPSAGGLTNAQPTFVLVPSLRPPCGFRPSHRPIAAPPAAPHPVSRLALCAHPFCHHPRAMRCSGRSRMSGAVVKRSSERAL